MHDKNPAVDQHINGLNIYGLAGLMEANFFPQKQQHHHVFDKATRLPIVLIILTSFGWLGRTT
jgi:hypothetical protein